MENRKTYLIEFTTGELEAIIYGLSALQIMYDDNSFETLKKELESKLKGQQCLGVNRGLN